MPSTLARTIALGLCVSCAPQLHALDRPSPITSVITFGDSLSDAGSFGGIYGTTPGSSWTQLLARTYGDDQTPYLLAQDGKVVRILGGLNYAQGGSKNASPAMAGAAEDSIPHSARVQVRNHEHSFGRITPGQLVIVWTGCNDIITLFGHGDPATATPTERVLNTGEHVPADLLVATDARLKDAVKAEMQLIDALLADGATRIVVLNLPDLGLTPFQPNTTPGGLRLATRFTAVYNQELARAVPADPRLLFVDADGLLQRAARDPAAGFKYIMEDACKNQAFVCGPADYAEPQANETHLFAGFGHFTQHSRRLLAREVDALIAAKWPGSTAH